jgi:cytochrome P450
MGEESLLVKSGAEHKYLRALLAPAFSPEAVAGYVPQVVSLVEHHLAAWAAAGGEGVKGLDALKLLTFSFIVQVRLGSCRVPAQPWAALVGGCCALADGQPGLLLETQAWATQACSSVRSL